MTKHKATRQGAPLSQSEFIALIKEGESGSFTPVGTFEEFKKEVLTIKKDKKAE